MYMTDVQTRLQIDGATPAAANIVLSSKEIEAVLQAGAMIAANLTEPPSLAQMAETTGLSQRRLAHGFRQVFNTTVFGYMRETRLEAARQMLEDTDMPLKQIAFHVGYGHANNLIAAFRERYGIPPRRHARKLACG
jgi:transcriptional regulator GlxA family with amidase domain